MDIKKLSYKKGKQQTFLMHACSKRKLSATYFIREILEFQLNIITACFYNIIRLLCVLLWALKICG